MATNTEFPTLIKTISEHDEMSTGDAEDYLRIGRAGFDCVSDALRLIGRATCTSILDLPCGHGRVMRYLRAAFPDARITACDLNRTGVDYCAKTFGATPVHSKKRIQDVVISDRFDLIWCGSLLTHLEKPLWHPFLSFFAEHLSEDGLLVFTTHGRLSAKWIREKIHTYALNPKELPRVLAAYDRKGFGYAPYPCSPDYGITLSSPAWVLEQIQQYPNLRMVLLSEMGWSNHQDVYACVRVKNTF